MPRFAPELDGEIQEIRGRFRHRIRHGYEVARNRWDELSSREGARAGSDARLLLSWAQIVEGDVGEGTRRAAETLDLLRIASGLLEGGEEARSLGEWLIPEILRQALESGDLELTKLAMRFSEELTIGRWLERGYRSREDRGTFDPVSLGRLHGVIEAKYAKPYGMAARTGAQLAGAPNHAQDLAEAVGEAGGLAAGYHLALIEGWDPEVIDQKGLRRRLVKEGQRAVEDFETAVGVVKMQRGLEYSVEVFEQWIECLLSAFEELR